jgi:hypothetical protein
MWGATHAGHTYTQVSVPVAEAGFFNLEDAYLPARKCCDLFTYKLIVMRDGTAKTVTTVYGAQQPPALALALNEVSALTK